MGSGQKTSHAIINKSLKLWKFSNFTSHNTTKETQKRYSDLFKTIIVPQKSFHEIKPIPHIFTKPLQDIDEIPDSVSNCVDICNAEEDPFYEICPSRTDDMCEKPSHQATVCDTGTRIDKKPNDWRAFAANMILSLLASILQLFLAEYSRLTLLIIISIFRGLNVLRLFCSIRQFSISIFRYMMYAELFISIINITFFLLSYLIAENSRNYFIFQLPNFGE